MTIQQHIASFPHTIPSLIVLSLYALFLPYVAILYEHIEGVTMGMLALLLILAAIRRAWFDASLASFVLILYVIFRQIWPALSDILYTYLFYGAGAYIGLNLTLLIGPWSRFYRHLQWLLSRRRHLAVTTFFLAFAHGNLIFQNLYDAQISGFSQTTFVIFGLSGFYILLLLAITSWNFFQGRLPLQWWNWIHPATLVVFVGLLIAQYQSSEFSVQPWQAWVLTVFVVFWIVVAPGVFSRFLRRAVRGWKQLHFLIYIAYASIAIHVWEAGLLDGALALQVVFWVLVVLVCGSHLYGWMLVFKHYWQREQRLNITSQL